MERRVTFLIPGLNVGGAERHTTDLRQMLDGAGYDTSLIVFGRRKSDIMLRHPGARDALLLGAKGMSDLKGWWGLMRALRRQKPHVIVAVNQSPLILAIVLRLLGRLPTKIVCVFHTTLLRESEKRNLPVFKSVAKLADCMVFVSYNQSRYWNSRGLAGRSNAVIQNGVDAAHFDPAPYDRHEMRSRIGFGRDDFVICCVAALRAEKNHLALIDAIERLRGRGVEAKLLLVGDGPTRAAIEAAAEARGVRRHVTLAGEQGDIRPFVAASDVGINCSVAVETFSISALECLSMGVPMIMSRIGGADEIVSHGVNGYVFEADDGDDMVEAIMAFFGNGQRDLMREAARASALGFSPQRMLASYLEILR